MMTNPFRQSDATRRDASATQGVSRRSADTGSAEIAHEVVGRPPSSATRRASLTIWLTLSVLFIAVVLGAYWVVPFLRLNTGHEEPPPARGVDVGKSSRE